MQQSSRLVLALAAVATLAGRGAVPVAAQRTGPDQTPSFRSGVEVVTVDVGVVDKQGRPLRGLAPADFTVTVAGRARHVVTAEYIEPVVAPASAAPARPAVDAVSTNEGGGTGRLFVFLVDQNTLDLGSARRVAAASAPFLSRLSFADRSALMLMPLGPNVAFTWAHDRVREGLLRVSGTGLQPTGWEFGSLAEARDIANHTQFATRGFGDRNCDSISASGIGSGSSGPPSGGAASPGGTSAPTGGGAPSGGGGGAGSGGGAGGGTTPGPAGGSSSGGGGSGGGQRSSAASGGGGGLGGGSLCGRDLQMQAEGAWRAAQMNSLASISALRQSLAALARVRGDKTVILISGGWPLDDRDQMSLLSMVAGEAAAARVTLHSIYIPATIFGGDRRTVTSSPLADNLLFSGPLETLAAMSGGASFRAEVSADAAFERLGRELAGYYRIGIEKDPTDGDGKGRRMKVQVARDSATIRARDIFDVRAYEDRDWAARLASAIEGPVPSTDIGMRVTSYVSADPEDGSRRRLLLSGELRRAQPGEATLQLLVSDLQGKKVTAGEVTLTNKDGEAMPFSTNVAVPPGSYIVRVGVMDVAGRVGSVDHRVDVADVSIGALTATGPVLVRVPDAAQGDPSLALDAVRQDERLAMEIGIEGDQRRVEGAGVQFEIAASADGPALVQAPAALARSTRDGLIVAQGVADMRVLPPGSYVIRAKVMAGSETLGNVRRSFAVTAASPAVATTDDAAGAGSHLAVPNRPAGRMPVAAVAPFGLDQVLAPPVLGAFLDRVATRPDAAAPAMRDLLERARTTGVDGLVVSDAQAAAAPTGAFLRGLTLLADHKLEPAAAAFREAMRQSADFYPAMIYLGACYAAGGRDKEAAAAWRTALIRENDTPALHAMLADALLRQGRGDLAIDDLTTARARWPQDAGLQRRYAIAALLGGQRAEGMRALDELVEQRADDERSLALALLILYEAFGNDQPVENVDQDRARMVRFADAYRTRGGPAVALIDTWLAASAPKR